jgi:DNA-binding SARP family transcriptional activator
MRTLARRLLLSLCAVVLVATIWLLSESRPPLPATARFTTASGADRLLGFVAWLGCLVLAIGLLYRIARHNHQSGAESPASIRHLHPLQRERSRRRAEHGYPDRAFPLIPRSPLPHETVSDVEPSQPEPHQAPESSPGLPWEDPEPAARISLLGPVTIVGGRKRGRRLRGATRELLTYLALQPTGAQRDQITDALWPDQPPEQGRNRLWRAAADARTHLGDNILARDGDHYELDRTRITVDLDQFEQLLAGLGRAATARDELPLLESALALFTGEPLAGSDFPWAENEQRRLHALQLDVFERAGRAHLASGDPSGALASAEMGLAREPYNEKLVRVAMQAEAALGLRSAIIARYENVNKLLDEQLGLQPHRDTRRLYRQLLSQDGLSERGGARDGEAAERVADSWPEELISVEALEAEPSRDIK